MNVMLLDLVTGETKDSQWEPEASVFWWTRGNGSCDCNRALAFGGSDLLDAQKLRLGLADNICLGYERWRVVGVDGDLEGHAQTELIEMANVGYPDAH